MRNQTVKAKNNPNLWKECESCHGDCGGSWSGCRQCYGTGISVPENISDEYKHDMTHWESGYWKATGLCGGIEDKTMEEDIDEDAWTPVLETAPLHPQPHIHTLKMITLPKKSNKSFLQQIKKVFTRNQSKSSGDFS